MWVGYFKLLGAPFASHEFCKAQLKKRADKASRIMEELGKLENPQTAMLLLQHCTGFCKVTYSMRTVPSGLHRDALDEYSERTRRAL